MAHGWCFCSDVPGEQPGRHHGVWLRRRPDLAPRAVHDRVLARDVAAGEDGWYILKGCLPVQDSSSLNLMQSFTSQMYKLSTDSSALHPHMKHCNRSEEVLVFF